MTRSSTAAVDAPRSDALLGARVRAAPRWCTRACSSRSTTRAARSVPTPAASSRRCRDGPHAARSIPTSATGPRPRPGRHGCTRSTTRVTSATSWINVTTLPMVVRGVAAVRRSAGPRPCCCSRCSARCSAPLAARALARRIGGGDGWCGVLGRRTRVARRDLRARFLGAHPRPRVHALGRSCCCSSVVDARARRWRRARSSPACCSEWRATMRTEALVYGAVATACPCSAAVVIADRLLRAPWSRRWAWRAACRYSSTNDRLERIVFGGSSRRGRAAGTAARGSGIRGRDPLATHSARDGLRPRSLCDRARAASSRSSLVAVWRWAREPRVRPRCRRRRARRRRRAAPGPLRRGLGFVSGMLVALPVRWCSGLCSDGATDAPAHPRAWRSRRSRGLAVPVPGGAGPQWGGRYVLLSGVLLAVVGIVVTARRAALVATIAACRCVVTGCGVVWLSDPLAPGRRRRRQIVARRRRSSRRRASLP